MINRKELKGIEQYLMKDDEFLKLLSTFKPEESNLEEVYQVYEQYVNVYFSGAKSGNAGYTLFISYVRDEDGRPYCGSFVFENEILKKVNIGVVDPSIANRVIEAIESNIRLALAGKTIALRAETLEKNSKLFIPTVTTKREIVEYFNKVRNITVEQRGIFYFVMFVRPDNKKHIVIKYCFNGEMLDSVYIKGFDDQMSSNNYVDRELGSIR